MNAIQFLLREHEHVRRSFRNISDPTHRFDTQRQMLDELCDELLIHESMEETIWYPYLKECGDLVDIIPHLLSEEKKAEKLIKEISHVSSPKEWEEKFAQLKHDIEHHASEEETKLFPRVEKILDEEELDEIGKEMMEFKKDCMQQAREYKKQKSLRRETSATA